jgi:hypothetical protein
MKKDCEDLFDCDFSRKLEYCRLDEMDLCEVRVKVEIVRTKSLKILQ